jgi:putative membrane protein
MSTMTRRVPSKIQWVWMVLLAVAIGLAQIDQPLPEVAPLHHIPTVILLLAMPFLLKRWPLSDGAFGCFVFFLLLHTLGGRYTYTSVPYEEWYATLTGGDWRELTGWTRNNYDRLVHLAFGMLMVRPVVEIGHINGLVRRAGLWVAFAFVLSMSCLYEIFEWALTLVAAGPLADQYNGQQGDMWDAQKDMALAACGALISCLYLWVRSRGRA